MCNIPSASLNDSSAHQWKLLATPQALFLVFLAVKLWSYQ